MPGGDSGGLPAHVLRHAPLTTQAPVVPPAAMVHVAETGPTKPVAQVPVHVEFTREVVEQEKVALGALGAVEQTAAKAE